MNAELHRLDLEAIQQVAKAKTLDTWGYVYMRQEVPFTENEVTSVNRCWLWILENCKPRKQINDTRSSYNLKHVVERYCGDYIPNGSFCVAGVIAGYRSRIVNNMNLEFNFSFRKGCFNHPGVC